MTVPKREGGSRSRPVLPVNVLVTLSSRYNPIPDAELICWVQSSFYGSCKLLVVQRVGGERSYFGDPSRSLEIDEVVASELEAAELRESLDALLPRGGELQVKDTSCVESIWSAHLRLEIEFGARYPPLDVGLGPEGIRGDHAERLRDFFRVLLGMARCRDEAVLQLLTTPRPDF
jgi:hypothetical protein